MALSYELISQFAKLVNQDKKTNAETTVYGTIVVDGENKYVQLDGSDQLIPIEDGSTSANANADERVSVLIKNHTATVTGNVSSPAARTGDVNDLSGRVTEVEKFDIVLAERVEANEAYIEKLQADVAEFGDLKAATAKIEELEANDVRITGRLDASEAEIDDLKTTKLDAEVADITFATIKSLEATDIAVAQLDANKASVEELAATEARIGDLVAKKANISDLNATNAKIENLEAEDATIKGTLTAQNAKISTLEAEDAKINGTLTAHNAVIANLNSSYANIDFANITRATIETFFSKSGMIENVVIGDSSVTGTLCAVTLKGDLIEAGTLKADKLVVKGSDGIFYKLNVEAGGVSAEEAPDDGLHGSAIVAKSITAEKVSVHDLVAFGATIGGFNITDSAIFSGAKGSVNADAIEGVYFDSSGQFAIGNATSFIKYYRGVTTGKNLFHFPVDETVSGEYEFENPEDDYGDVTWSYTTEGSKIIISDPCGDITSMIHKDYDLRELLKEVDPNKTLTISVTGDHPAVDVYIGDVCLYSGDTVENFTFTLSDLDENARLSLLSYGGEGTIYIQIEEGSTATDYVDYEPGARKLAISADEITFGTGRKSVEDAIDEVAESTRVNTENLTDYISATTKELENLQGQIDGSITTWFYEYVPTKNNIPASEWTTTDLKNNHLGDLFYDTLTGYCYRWQVLNNEYFWTLVKDTDVTKALENAAKAQSTADNKRRVFVSTPKPPYDIGDLWTQGATGDLMRCQTAKTASQTYAAADWVKASKYTDDTVANRAQAAANALNTRVTSAETQIIQNKENIELQAKKTTELDNKFAGYYTKTEADSKIKQSADAITLSVEEKISAVEIGGRNLLLNSGMKENLDEWEEVGNILDLRKTVSGGQSVRADDISSKEHTVTVLAKSKNLFNPSKILELTGWTVDENGLYSGKAAYFHENFNFNTNGYMSLEGIPVATFSFYARNERTDNTNGLGVYFVYDDDTRNGFAVRGNVDKLYTVTSDINKKLKKLCFSYGSDGQTHYLHDIQLEIGATATPYTPYITSIGDNLLGDYSLEDYFGGDDLLCNLVARDEPYVVSSVFYSAESEYYSIFFEDDYYVEDVYQGDLVLIPEVGDKVYCVDVNGSLYAHLANTVDVQVCGKNLVDVDKMLNVNLAKDENGVYRIIKGSTMPYKFTTPIPANTPFVISYKNFEGYNANSNALFSHSLYFADGTSEGGNWVGGNWKSGTAFYSKLTINKAKPVTGFNINTYNPSSDFYASFTGLQVELGTSETEHELYKEPIVYTVVVNEPTEIKSLPSPSATVISASESAALDLTYRPISGFIEKNGKQCLDIKHLTLGETKSVRQNVFSRIDRDSKCMFSGWFMIENLTKGTNPICALTIGDSIKNFDLSSLTPGQWKYETFEVDTTALSETATDCFVEIIASDVTGDLYICDLKLEKGNKATDWTPAPEDVDKNIADKTADLQDKIVEANASIEIKADEILLAVSEQYATKDELSGYTKTSEFRQTAEGLEGRVTTVEGDLKSGEFDKVQIKGKNYKMDSEGFKIEDADSTNKIKTAITNDGMTVSKDNDDVLIANHTGVEATDLHAKTYLIIAGKSRFEKYGSDRIGCFWVG